MPNGLSGLAAKKYNYSLAIVRSIRAVELYQNMLCHNATEILKNKLEKVFH